MTSNADIPATWAVRIQRGWETRDSGKVPTERSKDTMNSEEALSSISHVLSLKGSGRLKLRLIKYIAAEYFEAEIKAQRETDATPPIKPED